jgi:hypothetical protein
MDPRYPNEFSLKINRDTVSTTSTNNTVFRLPSVSVLQSAERAGALCFFDNQCWYFSEVSNEWLPFATGLATTLEDAGIIIGHQPLEAIASAYPTFLTKGLNAGTGVSLSSTGTDITITATTLPTTLSDAGAIIGHQVIEANGSAYPAFLTKGLNAGAGITLSNSGAGTGTDITIAATTLPTTLTGDGQGANQETLIATASAYPSFLTKGLDPGVGVTFSSTATDITVNAALVDAGVAVGRAGIPVTTPAPVANAAFPVKGIVAGAGITVTSNNTDITIASSASNTIGAAEYNYTTQSPNNSVPPGTAFTISSLVYNSVPSAIVASAAAGGTVFTLTAGTYVIDYEMSLGSAGSIALYTGPNSGSLTIDNNTIAGSTTATTWIHGRAIEVVGSTLVVAVSSVVGTAAVVTAGTAAGIFMVRITFLKIA